MLPKRLEKYNLQVAPDKTNCHRFSRFKPSLKNRFMFLSFEFYWDYDKTGNVRLFRRTSRDRLRSTKNKLSEYFHAVGKLYKWLKRRSGRKSMTWARLKRVIAYSDLVKPICKASSKRMKVWW